MSTSSDFQKRINELVDELELKKSILPSKMGVDYRSLANALNYGIIPTPRILIRIADYFNVSIKYLLGQTNDEYFNKASNTATFKERFNALCLENKVKYYKVSKDCHFSNSYVSRWFKYNYLPSWEFLELISDYFDVSVDYLLGRTEDKN